MFITECLSFCSLIPQKQTNWKILYAFAEVATGKSRTVLSHAHKRRYPGSLLR